MSIFNLLIDKINDNTGFYYNTFESYKHIELPRADLTSAVVEYVILSRNTKQLVFYYKTPAGASLNAIVNEPTLDMLKELYQHKKTKESIKQDILATKPEGRNEARIWMMALILGAREYTDENQCIDV